MMAASPSPLVVFRRRGPLAVLGRLHDDANADGASRDAPGTAGRTGPSLTTLPPEIHLMVAAYLIYPDALSLKHASRYFYYIVDTGIRLKVDWLLERRSLHLDCPRDMKCDLGSDSKFCRGSVRLLMQRRREHVECEGRPNLGCLVFGTKTCAHKRKLASRFGRTLRLKMTVELWNVLLVLVPVLVACLWTAGLFAA